MPSASKVKGSGFEREIAKYLSDIYNENFIRNINGSGAYVGGKNSFRKKSLTESQVRQAKGDVTPPESFSLMNIEAKFYADFGFHQLFDESKILDSWIDQMMQASDPGDLNILFMKFNRKGRYVAVQDTDDWEVGCNIMYYTNVLHGRWMIYSFDKFFEINTEKLKLNSRPKQSSNT